MGKSKKKKTKDFQKVKLKVGKKLKKADNVTNASFQTRTIQVTQHLKTEGPEPSTKRKLNIQELLSQCQHYSITVRHDAVTGLRELLNAHPELLVSHLATVLDKVCALFVDKDPVVRQAVVKLLKVILPSIKEKQISSFFPIVSAHLCCSMTHIYDDIQLDSLSILDLFLDNYPHLVVTNSNQLLPNFIEQISRSRSSSSCGSKSGTSKDMGGGRSLSINPNSKTSSQKWRARVLERLHKLLEALLKTEATTAIGASRDIGDVKRVIWSEDVNECCHLPRPQAFSLRMQSQGISLSMDNDKSTKGKKTENKFGLTDDSGIKKYVQVVTPLLLECWVEADTSQHFSRHADKSGLISGESVPLRSSVLQVIQLLWQCVYTHNPAQMEWLRESYMKDFENSFLGNFPFSVHKPAQKGKRKESDVELSASGINLAICDIMTHFMASPSSNQSMLKQDVLLPWEPTVCNFLEEVLTDVHHSTTDTRTVIDILNRLLLKYDYQENLEALLTSALTRYKDTHPLSAERKLYFSFFADIILDPKYTTKVTDDLREQFLRTLPGYFTQAVPNNSVTGQVLKVMKRSVCQSPDSSIVKEIMENFIQQVIDEPKPLLQKLDMESQRECVELIYYLPTLHKKCLMSIATLCRDDYLSTDTVLYLLQILNYRHMRMQRSCEETGYHISTLLSVLIGERQRQHNDMDESSSHCHGEFTVVCHFNMASWERSFRIAKGIGGLLQQFSNSEQVAEILINFISTYLSKKCTVDSNIVIGITVLANQMQFDKHPMNTSLLKQFIDFIWCLLYIITTHKDKCGVTDCIQQVLDESVRFITQVNGGVELFLSNVMASSKDVDKKCLESICDTCSILLRSSEGRKVVKSKGFSLLQQFTEFVQTSFPSICQKQWWSDFEYVASLAV